MILPVQKQKLLLVSVPSQTAAELQSVVMGCIHSEQAQVSKSKHVYVVKSINSEVKNVNSPVQFFQEDSHRLSAYVHNL